jgi:hypothetical protein
MIIYQTFLLYQNYPAVCQYMYTHAIFRNLFSRLPPHLQKMSLTAAPSDVS